MDIARIEVLAARLDSQKTMSSASGSPNISPAESGLTARRILAAKASGGISADAIYRAIERELASLNAGGNILDYGAGKGNLSRRLANSGQFTKVFAVDLIPPDDQEPGGPVHWITKDLNDDGLRYDQCFDAIVSAEVIEHLENPRLMIRDLFRMLKPGGILVLSTPNNESLRSLISLVIRGHYAGFGPASYPAHITPMLRIDLERSLLEAGFTEPRFSFTDVGGIPGRPQTIWQTFSRQAFRGVLFSDNVLVSARRPLKNSL